MGALRQAISCMIGKYFYSFLYTVGCISGVSFVTLVFGHWNELSLYFLDEKILSCCHNFIKLTSLMKGKQIYGCKETTKSRDWNWLHTQTTWLGWRFSRSDCHLGNQNQRWLCKLNSTTNLSRIPGFSR